MQRIKEIDILKAYGIILMIMGHQYYGEGFDHWIHAFHMPVFFVVSGFLYKKKEIKVREFFAARVHTLLVPYLFFSACHLFVVILKILLRGTVEGESVGKYLYHILVYNHEGVPICGAIWFLTALFFVEMIYFLVDRMCDNKIIIAMIVIGMSGMGILLANVGIRLPLSFDVAMVALGFYYIGTLLRRLYNYYCGVAYNKALLYGLIGLVLCYFPIMYNDNVNMRLASHGNIVLFYFNGVCMSVVLFLMARYVANKDTWMTRELAFVGENSIIYLGFNQLILAFLKKIQSSHTAINLIIKIVALIVCLMLCHIILILLKKMKLVFFVGK